VFALGHLCLLLAFTGQAEIVKPHEAAKTADVQLNRAEAAFDRAHDAYESGRISEGDAALEEMNKALDACVESLDEAHKSRLYKKAEQRVANLQRRMASLLEDIALPQRGWAEQMSRKLEEIHDKLLAGVMRK
jgi:DNA-binding transcriptional MerR regulator